MSSNLKVKSKIEYKKLNIFTKMMLVRLLNNHKINKNLICINKKIIML